jgi:hypothetical protein
MNRIPRGRCTDESRRAVAGCSPYSSLGRVINATPSLAVGTANGPDTASRALVKAAGESSKGVGAARRGSGTVAVFDPPPGGLKEDPREPKAQAVGGLLASHSPFCFDDGGETFQLDSLVP